MDPLAFMVYEHVTTQIATTGEALSAVHTGQRELLGVHRHLVPLGVASVGEPAAAHAALVLFFSRVGSHVEFKVVLPAVTLLAERAYEWSAIFKVRLLVTQHVGRGGEALAALCALEGLLCRVGCRVAAHT